MPGYGKSGLAGLIMLSKGRAHSTCPLVTIASMPSHDFLKRRVKLWTAFLAPRTESFRWPFGDAVHTGEVCQVTCDTVATHAGPSLDAIELAQ